MKRQVPRNGLAGPVPADNASVVDESGRVVEDLGVGGDPPEWDGVGVRAGVDEAVGVLAGVEGLAVD